MDKDKRPNMSLDEGRQLHRVADAAQFLALSRSKLYAMMDAGELPYVKIGRSRRISTRRSWPWWMRAESGDKWGWAVSY